MKLRVFVFVVAVLLATACTAPKTKEAYMKKYEAFVERVEKNHSDYNKNDWKYADKKIKQFNEKYYSKFEDELTIKDQLKIGALSLKYNSLKGEEEFGKAIKKEIQHLKDEVEYYIENDMDEDLDKLIEGAGQIGDSLGVVIEDLVKEIRNKL